MKTTWKITFAVLLMAISAPAQEQLISLSFEDAPIEQAVELYREWTGRTIIRQADLSARITLKGRQLTQDEAKQAIETVLSMNGIALVPMGDRFLKVVPIANARQEGMSIKPFDPEQKYTEADQLITQVIPLRYVVFADVQPLIQHLVHGYGKIIEMARINSVLITDTSANIARIVELVGMVDQPAEKIEPRIYQLKYAEAATISGKLKELVEAAKTKKNEQTVVENVRTIPGVIRAPKADSGAGDLPQEQPTEMIVGEVKIVSDDRTNIIIVFSKAANFDFFDRIIQVLDVPVDPAVTVEVVKLEYAKAKEISGILNEFVGAAKATEKTKTGGTGTGAAEGSKTVDEVIQRAVVPAGREISPEVKSAIGRLSADTKIISDERSNSLLLMGRKSDIAAIKEVIAGLDVMLSQVLLETVIIDVSLGDNFSSGVQWLYSSIKGTSNATFGAGWGVPNILGSATNANLAADVFGGTINIPKISAQAVVNLTKGSSDAKILSAPVVLTTDNKEAKISSGEQVPISATTYSGSGITSQSGTQYKDATLDLTITPHINPQNFVLMDIEYSETQVLEDGTTTLGPKLSTRTMNATIAVDDRSTVVLGGLVKTRDSKTHTGIPLLGDIPLIGRLFSQKTSNGGRSELIVLITPYVLTTPEQAKAITERIHSNSDINAVVWPRGWSESSLRNDEPEKDEWKKGDKKNRKKAKDAADAVAPAEPAPVESPAAVTE